MNAPLIAFLFEFITTTIVIPIVVAIVVVVIIAPLLEFLFPVIAVIATAAKGIAAIVPVVPLTVVFLLEALDKRRVGKFKLAVGEIRELALDGVVMDHLLMPVAIGQLHVISDRIGKPGAFVRIFFGQRLVDHYFQVLTQMRELGITLGITQRFGSCL